jgi:hypothetical protein
MGFGGEGRIGVTKDLSRRRVLVDDFKTGLSALSSMEVLNELLNIEV